MEILEGPLPDIFSGAFIGNLLTAVCFGVLTIQTSSYYRAFPNDGRPVKVVVGFLWFLEGFQLACGTQSFYWWIVKNYNNPLALDRTWESTTFQISAACASVTVQTFFAHRVYSLSGNLYLGVLVQVLVLVQFGFGATTAVRSNMIPKFEVISQEGTWSTVSWLTIQATVDVVIAICMCLLLRRRRTGFRKTDSMLTHMILYAMGTGLATSVLSCLALFLFTKYQLGYSVPLGGFYSVTMLANLQMRKTLQARLDTPSLLEIISSSIRKRIRQNVGDRGNKERFQATRINIAREVVYDDVDIKPMSHQNSDTKVQFTVVQSLICGGPETRTQGSARSP